MRFPIIWSFKIAEDAVARKLVVNGGVPITVLLVLETNRDCVGFKQRH